MMWHLVVATVAFFLVLRWRGVPASHASVACVAMASSTLVIVISTAIVGVGHAFGGWGDGRNWRQEVLAAIGMCLIGSIFIVAISLRAFVRSIARQPIQTSRLALGTLGGALCFGAMPALLAGQAAIFFPGTLLGAAVASYVLISRELHHGNGVASVSGGAVQQADAADEARKSCR